MECFINDDEAEKIANNEQISIEHNYSFQPQVLNEHNYAAHNSVNDEGIKNTEKSDCCSSNDIVKTKSNSEGSDCSSSNSSESSKLENSIEKLWYVVACSAVTHFSWISWAS